MTVAIRAVAVWFGILVLAVMNGGVRDGLLGPVFGDTVARAISTVILCLLIAAVAWASIRWIGPATRGQAWGIGLLWLALTLAFEFLAGRYLFGKPWTELLADYDLSRGRIWVAALAATLVAPPWAAAKRRFYRP